MDAAPAFSVVVTSYNYRDFVAEAVDGALAQVHAPLEVVVVDDGSTDGSPDYLRERYGSEPRVKLLCGENGGQLAAFQRGLAAAEGEVVCFLDADDRWGPDYLRQLGEVFAARKDVDFVFSDVRLVGNESGVQGYAKQAVDLGHTVLGTWVYARWYGAPTSALALRRGLARRVLDLPPEFAANWRISADNCLVFGASILGARKYFLPTGSVDYRIHGRNGWWHEQARMRDGGAIGRDLVMLHALGRTDNRRISEAVVGEFFADVLVPLLDDALDARALLALRRFADRFERLLEPGNVLFGLAEMLLEPRPPRGYDAVAGLQHGSQARSCPSPDQAEMAAVRARQELEDGVGFPVAPDAEHDALVAPLHR